MQIPHIRRPLLITPFCLSHGIPCTQQMYPSIKCESRNLVNSLPPEWCPAHAWRSRTWSRGPRILPSGVPSPPTALAHIERTGSFHCSPGPAPWTDARFPPAGSLPHPFLLHRHPPLPHKSIVALFVIQFPHSIDEISIIPSPTLIWYLYSKISNCAQTWTTIINNNNNDESMIKPVCMSD